MSNTDESYPQQLPGRPSRQRSRIALLLTLALVLFTGGGAIGYQLGQSDSSETVAATQPADTQAAADAPMHTPEPDVTGKKVTGQLDKAQVETSDRGLTIKTVGETAGVGEPADNLMAEFTIAEITVDPQCTSEYAEAAQNGHLVLVSITATVQPGFTEWSEEYGTFATGLPFYPEAFGLLDADGVVVNEPATMPAYWCLDEGELMPSEVTDGQTATGMVVLDSPTPTGVLTYQPWGTGDGWEWEF